ncbi:MAG: rhomboid family intramembrane serine protease [Verrucomicrobiales bacterium]|nr:rhomboid family intramembrane serine protease [Verrucomicrobiales bacterium]
MLFFPIGINALYQQRPYVNWFIVLLTIVVSALAFASADSFDGNFTEPFLDMVLWDWEPVGMLGHMLLHADFFHLAGNMVFLWVFGNAICANMNQFLYLAVYIVLGFLAGAAHLAFDGNPAIGASGALNGVIGLALAVYPRDEVDVFYLFIVKWGTFQMPVWGLVIIWLAFDIWGVVTGGESVAYFAHIGGLVAGIGIGLVLLHFGKIDLTIYDRQTLLEFIKGEDPEKE